MVNLIRVLFIVVRFEIGAVASSVPGPLSSTITVISSSSVSCFSLFFAMRNVLFAEGTLVSANKMSDLFKTSVSTNDFVPVTDSKSITVSLLVARWWSSLISCSVLVVPSFCCSFHAVSCAASFSFAAFFSALSLAAFFFFASFSAVDVASCASCSSGVGLPGLLLRELRLLLLMVINVVYMVDVYVLCSVYVFR